MHAALTAHKCLTQPVHDHAYSCKAVEHTWQQVMSYMHCCTTGTDPTCSLELAFEANRARARVSACSLKFSRTTSQLPGAPTMPFIMTAVYIHCEDTLTLSGTHLSRYLANACMHAC